MNKAWLAAGCLNVITALIHTIAGEIELITPYAELQFDTPLKAILHACWHMVTVTLFGTSIVLVTLGLKPEKPGSARIAWLVGLMYVAFTLVFLAVSVVYGVFLFQPVLLLPIGVLAGYGARRASLDRLPH